MHVKDGHSELLLCGGHDQLVIMFIRDTRAKGIKIGCHVSPLSYIEPLKIGI